MGRQQIAIKGGIVGISSQIISLLAKFIVRTFIIRYLGKEILGLDSVLLDIVNMLSLAELGITSAMLFRLYTPVIEEDYDRISELMATYKWIYRIIAGIIVVIGCVFAFFLPLVIRGLSISWNYIYLAYFLQLGCTVSSYLLAYQRILLNADQKKHLCMLVDLVANIAFTVFKILGVIIFSSYAVYLVMTIVQTVFANLYLKLYVKKVYRQLNYRAKSKREDVRSLFRDAKEVLGGKLAGYVYNSTDNLIISIFMGTVSVGLLSNYKYIATALRGLVNSAMTAMQPLLGNYLNSDNDKQATFRTLMRYSFVRFFIAGITTIPFITVAHDFVEIWTKDTDYLLDSIIVILLAADYYIGCVYGPLGEYILGKGLFKEEKKVTLLAAFSNICVSLIGVRIWGFKGVLLATVLCQIILWLGKGYYVFKKFYEGTSEYVKQYIWFQMKGMGVVTFAVLFMFFLKHYYIQLDVVVRFVIGSCISVIVFLFLMILCFRKSDEFRYSLQLIKNTINNKMR